MYQFLVLQPTLRDMDAERRRELLERAAASWRPWVFAAMGALLISGLMNFLMFKVPAYRGHPSVAVYHGLFGLKFLMALAAFHPLSMLVMPGEKFQERYRARSGLWLGFAVTAVTIVIVLAAVMSNFDRLFPRAAS
jgi:hypothetical protein